MSTWNLTFSFPSQPFSCSFSSFPEWLGTSATVKHAPVPWRTFQAAMFPCLGDDHVKKEPVGREIKHEICERSREFLSGETKLEWVDGEDRHTGDRSWREEVELRYSTCTFWRVFKLLMKVTGNNYFSDWSHTLRSRRVVCRSRTSNL